MLPELGVYPGGRAVCVKTAYFPQFSSKLLINLKDDMFNGTICDEFPICAEGLDETFEELVLSNRKSDNA